MAYLGISSFTVGIVEKHSHTCECVNVSASACVRVCLFSRARLLERDYRNPCKVLCDIEILSVIHR